MASGKQLSKLWLPYEDQSAKQKSWPSFFTGKFEQTSSIKPKPGFLFGMAFLKGPCYAAQLVKAFADGADRRVGVWIPSPGREL